jgi:hypothetical protein
MSQQDLAAADINTWRSNPPTRYAGRSAQDEQSWACSETAPASHQGQRPSIALFGPPSKRLRNATQVIKPLVASVIILLLVLGLIPEVLP